MHVPESETYCAAYVATTDGGLDYLQTEHDVGVGNFARPELHDSDDLTDCAPHFVMTAADELHSSGKNVTPHAIRHELKANSVFQRLGGEEWWSSFIGVAGDGADIDLHAPRVRLASRLRSIQPPATEIQHVCTNGHRPSEAIEQVEKLTQELLEAQVEQRSNVMSGRDMAEGIMEMVTSEEPANLTLHTGFPSFDDQFNGLIQNRLNVIAARTDHGKSAWADQVALNVARRYRKQGSAKKVLVFDLENDESAKQLRYASNLSGVPIQKISRHVEQEERLADPHLKRVLDAAEKIQELPLVVDTTSGASSTHIRSRVLTEAAQDEDVGLVVVDYLTLLGEKGDGAMEQVMNAVRNLHQLAQELELTILGVSQINRKPVSADDPVPKLHHMSWSDDVAKKPAQVITLCHHLAHWDQTSRNSGGRPDPERLTVFVRKNKGPKGPAEMRFEKDCLRIVDKEDPEPYETRATTQSGNDDPPF